MTVTLNPDEKPFNVKRMLWSIMGACGGMCIGVLVALILILNNASDQRIRENNQTAANRVGSCNQYNQQQKKNISNDRAQAESSAIALIKAASQLSPNPPPQVSPAILDIIKKFVSDQGDAAEITSRKNNPFRNCSTAGIDAFLKLTTTVECVPDKLNPGFCKVNNPEVLSTTTTTPTSLVG